MVIRRQLSREQAETAMRGGEFDDSVLGAARNVAVVLTQDWCGQWMEMDRYLGALAARPPVEQPDVTVFQLVYNRVDYFETFMHFKEQVFGSDQIPYVRYYRDGRLVGRSNFVSATRFLAHFVG